MNNLFIQDIAIESSYSWSNMATNYNNAAAITILLDHYLASNSNLKLILAFAFFWNSQMNEVHILSMNRYSSYICLLLVDKVYLKRYSCCRNKTLPILIA
jgi:hypothetical protein